jgi:hypothetical protein
MKVATSEWSKNLSSPSITLHLRTQFLTSSIAYTRSIVELAFVTSRFAASCVMVPCSIQMSRSCLLIISSSMFVVAGLLYSLMSSSNYFR